MSAALSTPGERDATPWRARFKSPGKTLTRRGFDACIRPAFHRRCSSVKGTRVRRTARAAGMSGTIVTGSGLSPRRRDSDRACAGQYRALCGKRGNRPKESDAGTRARRRLSGRTGGACACLRAHSTRRSDAQRPQPPGHPSRAWQRPQPRPSHSVRNSILRRLKPIVRSSPNRDEAQREAESDAEPVSPFGRSAGCSAVAWRSIAGPR